MDRLKTIRNLLTEKECQKIVDICDSKIDKKKTRFDINFYNQYRIFINDDDIFNLIKNRLEQIEENYSFDEEFSYVHYINQGFIRKHTDQYKNNQIQFTMLIYLNDDYKKGRTYFYNDEFSDNKTYIEPETGKAIIFPGNNIYHGSESVDGDKKILLVKIY